MIYEILSLCSFIRMLPNPDDPEVIAKPPNTSHAKFAKYAKFRFMDDFANLADFA